MCSFIKKANIPMIQPHSNNVTSWGPTLTYMAFGGTHYFQTIPPHSLPPIIRRMLNDICNQDCVWLAMFLLRIWSRGIPKNSLSSTKLSKLKCLLSENDSVLVPSSVVCKLNKKSLGILGVTSWFEVTNFCWTKSITLISLLMAMPLCSRMR